MVRPEVLLKRAEVQRRLGISRTKLHTMTVAGELPAPVRIGGRLGWLESELEQFIASLAEQRAR